MLRCELKRVVTEQEWDVYHSIRERVLWTTRGDVGAYTRSHPDERAPGHYPLLLLRDGDPVGVVRVDVDPPDAWFRRVAVREDVQRQGCGRRLVELAQEFAVSRGCTRLCSNVAPDAVGFYRKLGFHHRGVESEDASIPMEKHL